MSKNKYRRPTPAPRVWWAPLKEDAPDGVEETAQHPHIQWRSPTMGESLEFLESASALENLGESVTAEDQSKFLNDQMEMVAGLIHKVAGNWGLFPALCAPDTTDTLAFVRSLDSESWATVSSGARLAGSPTDDEKKP